MFWFLNCYIYVFRIVCNIGHSLFSSLAIDKANLSDILPMIRGKISSENDTAALAFAAFRAILFGLPDLYNSTAAMKQFNLSENSTLDDDGRLFSISNNQNT